MHENPIFSGLNESQKAAVLHKGSPLLILAGAGSGKTRVITLKIAYLISQGVDPRSILAVTFTNKAAREMRERAACLEPAASECMIRTFHSFGSWMLRRNSAQAGIPAEFSIYDDDDQVSLLAGLYPEQSRQWVKGMVRSISRAKDLALLPADDLSAVHAPPEFAEVYQAYAARLQSIGNVDFGDLILRPLELLEQNPALADRFHSRFSVVLVDEYQDSNTAQFRLLEALTAAGTYVCVVGDDDQSIYRFRGAEVRNILDFPEHFPGTDIIRLEQNYRSTNAILQVAHAVVSNNEGRLGKELWTENGEGKIPLIAQLYDQDEEAEFCMQLIRKAPEADTAILYRTNAQSRVFETVFLRNGIPYRIVGTLRFYEREEVKDAIALLRFTANPRDPVSFTRIINKPARGIGKKSVEKILQHAGSADLMQAMDNASGVLPAKAARAVSGCLAFFSDIAAALRDQRFEMLSDLLDYALKASGLLQHHKEQDEIAGMQKVQNLEELGNAAAMYPGTIDGLVEFLEAIELDSGSSQETEAASVTLITMHNTKGLEFDRVIISGMDEGVFPRESHLDPDSMEEERRLFYVAVTRARHELYMTTTRLRRMHGRILDTSPSRFLREIPSELVRTSLGGGEAGSSEDSGLEYPLGSAVYHDDYGSGRVIRSEIKNGELVIMVQFETGRSARFLPAYTAIERISGDDW